MVQSEKSNRPARRRVRLSERGAKRVTVTVFAADAKLVKEVAKILRTGGGEAERVRTSLRPLVSSAQAETGRELVAFFRRSPLVGEDLDLKRGKSKRGRSVSFD